MTDKKQDGGPAYPTFPEEGELYPETGMSLRDAFAMAALTGLLSDNTNLVVLQNVGKADRAPTSFLAAREAYKFADAMLKQRDSDAGSTPAAPTNCTYCETPLKDIPAAGCGAPDCPVATGTMNTEGE